MIWLAVIGGLITLSLWWCVPVSRAEWRRSDTTVRDALTYRHPAMRQHVAYVEARTDWLAQQEAGARDEPQWQAQAVRADLDQAMGTLPPGEYEVHVQEQPTPVMVAWTQYDLLRQAFIDSGSPSVMAAMLEEVKLPYDPNCTYPGCGGSGTVWDGGKLVKCPRCG